jgi:TRAP-type C4-dicarboxylate transport system substrate-binding protein
LPLHWALGLLLACIGCDASAGGLQQGGAVVTAAAPAVPMPPQQVLPTPAADPLRLRIVGSLGGLRLFTQHEQPFWTQRLPQASGGRIVADIVPADRAGIGVSEQLPLVQAGALPFSVILVSTAMATAPELGAIDLAGVHPDMASLRRSTAALRPLWEKLLRERHGTELLAVYTYPAQVLFCRRGWAGGLAGLKGLRVRTSSPSQSDWIEGLGGVPLMLPFNDIRTQLEAGKLDCAITSALSGNAVGLQDLTTQIHGMAVTWGVSLMVANGQAWKGIPRDLQQLMRRELAALETEVWAAAERDTSDGMACNTGAADCKGGKRGSLRAVAVTSDDEQRRRDVVTTRVLPGWLRRCGPTCLPAWNTTMAPLLGFKPLAPLALP